MHSTAGHRKAKVSRPSSDHNSGKTKSEQAEVRAAATKVISGMELLMIEKKLLLKSQDDVASAKALYRSAARLQKETLLSKKSQQAMHKAALMLAEAIRA